MIAVACAIIEHEGKVLVTRRGFHKAEGGLWEFPGGKLEAGESAESCVVREIAEELNLIVSPQHLLPSAVHHYTTKTIRLIPLICTWIDGTLLLREHAESAWLEASELSELHWCPADVPIMEGYIRWVANRTS